MINKEIKFYTIVFIKNFIGDCSSEVSIFLSKSEARNKGVDYINYQGKDWDICDYKIDIEEFKNVDIDYVSFSTNDGWVSLEIVPVMVGFDMFKEVMEETNI